MPVTRSREPDSVEAPEKDADGEEAALCCCVVCVESMTAWRVWRKAALRCASALYTFGAQKGDISSCA